MNLISLPLKTFEKVYWGLQNLCTKKAKSKKCKAVLIWHIKWLIIILWALHQWPVNRAWFELFALLGAKILQTPVVTFGVDGMD